MPIRLHGGVQLSPSGDWSDDDVWIEGGRLVEGPVCGAVEIACDGCRVLPGMVDIHGDAFERDIEPRPGVRFPIDIAMTNVDRQLISNGITTAYHGLTVSWEPGARSLEAGVAFMQVMAGLRDRLIADHRVQIRWETFALDAVETVMAWLEAEPRPALAFNDHTTATIEKVAAGNTAKLADWAARACLTPDDYLAKVHTAAEQGALVPGAITRVADAARAAGAPLLSHDDKTVETRAAFRDRGVTIAEFPLTHEAARDARDHHEPVVLGAPNVVRGGSHTGALSAEQAVRDGLCSVLASDYHYPSMLHAVARLVASGAAPLADAWALVAQNPAQALGLEDRGRLAPGCRADVVVVDWDSGPRPRVRGVIAAGRWFALT